MDGRRVLLLAVLLAATAPALTTVVQKWSSNSPAAGTTVDLSLSYLPPYWQPASRTKGIDVTVSTSNIGDGLCIFGGFAYAAVDAGWQGMKWFSLSSHTIPSSPMTVTLNLDMSQAPFGTGKPLWKLQLGFVVTSLDSSGRCPGPAPPSGFNVTKPVGVYTYYWDPDFQIAKGGGNMFFPSSSTYSGSWRSDMRTMLERYGGAITRIYYIGNTEDVPDSDKTYIEGIWNKGSPILITGSEPSRNANSWPEISRNVLKRMFYDDGGTCNSFVAVPYGLSADQMLKASAFARAGRKGVTPSDRRCFLVVDNPLSAEDKAMVSGKRVYSIGLSCSQFTSGGASACYGGSSNDEKNFAYRKMYMDTPDYSADAIFCDQANCAGNLRRLAIVSTLTDVRWVYTDDSKLDNGIESAKYAWAEFIIPDAAPSKYALLDSNGRSSAYNSDAQTLFRNNRGGQEMAGDTYLQMFDEAFQTDGDGSLSSIGEKDILSLYRFFYRRYDFNTCENARYLIITNISNTGLAAIAGGVTGVSNSEGGSLRKGSVWEVGCGASFPPDGGSPPPPPPPPPTVCTPPEPSLVPPDYPIELKDCRASPTSGAPGTPIAVENWIEQFMTDNELKECCVIATSSIGGSTVETITMPFDSGPDRYRGTFTRTNTQGTYSVRMEGSCKTATQTYSDDCTVSFQITNPPKPELRVRIAPGSSPACGETTTASILCEERPYGGSWQPANASTVTRWTTTGFVGDTCSPGVESCTGTVETFSDAPNVTVGATCYVAPGTHLVDSASTSAVIGCTGWTCRTRLRIMPRGTTTCGQTMTSDLSCEYWLGGGVWEPLSPAAVTGWTLNGFTSSNCAAGMSECTATLSTSAAQLNYYANATCRVVGGCAGDVSTANYLSCAESTTGDKIWIVNASCTPECVQTKMIERPHMFEYLLGHLNCPEMLPNSTLACRISVLNENPAAVNAILNLSLPSDYETQSVTLPAGAVATFDLSAQGPSALAGVFDGRIQLRKQGRLGDAHIVPILGSVGNLTTARIQQFAMPEYDGWLLPAALAILTVSMLLLRGRK